MPAARQLHPAVLAVAGVVAAAAFAFSADSWVQLAEIAGFRTHWKITDTFTLYLSWLMPLAYDAYTALSTWIYFTARTERLRVYAGRNAIASAALSVIVQGAYHGLKANEVDVASKWGLVVAIGAIPAGLLAAVVHLVAEYLRDRRAVAPPERAPVQEVAAPVEEVARPVQEVPRTDRARWVDRAGRAPLPIVAQSAPRTAQAAHRALLPVVAHPPAHLPAQPELPRVPAITLPSRTAPRTNGHRVLAPARTPTGVSRAPRPRIGPRPQPRTPRTPATSDDPVREAVAAHRAAHPDDDARATARAVHAAHPGTSARALSRALGCSDSTVRAYLKEDS